MERLADGNLTKWVWYLGLVGMTYRTLPMNTRASFCVLLLWDDADLFYATVPVLRMIRSYLQPPRG